MTPVAWCALFAIPAFFVQETLHELAHAAVLVLNGARPRISLKPFETDHGFRFASTTADADAWTFSAVIAPRVLNVAQVIALSMPRIAPGPVQSLALVWTIAAAVDFTVNTAGIFRPYHPCDAWDTWSQAGKGPTSLTFWRLASLATITALNGFALWEWTQ